MQSDNAPNLTAEVSNELMKASQITKVTSSAGHPRTQGLVGCQNRTLFTLLRVFCARRLRDWDQHLDEVLGAYNSTRHATTGFSPIILNRGTEKAIPLTYLYLQLQPLTHTWTTCWPANKKFMTWCVVTPTKLNCVKRQSTTKSNEPRCTSKATLYVFFVDMSRKRVLLR